MSIRTTTLPRVYILYLLLLVVSQICCTEVWGDAMPRVLIPGHHVPDAVATAQMVRQVEPNRPIRLTFVLPLRDPAGRADLLRRLYDPADPQYHRFLTASQFADRFAPSVESVNTIARFAASQGLGIREIASNRMMLVADGSAAVVEHALGVEMHDYIAQNETRFRAPDREPSIPAAIAATVLSVAGLDDLPAASPNVRRVLPTLDTLTALPDRDLPDFVSGTGPNGFLAPGDVKTAYALNTVSETGSGQVLGLFELDGYTASDIARYESEFYPNLTQVPLQTISVDGYSGKAESTGGASEVTLDIDMMIALAPRASRILVYEGDNTTAGLIAAYNKIASDDAANVVSSSWGLSEVAADYYGQVAPEGQIFEEMALQGQTILAASGDSGAYGDSWSLSVMDPASQPYVTGVGGTDLRLGASERYAQESAWGDAQDRYGLRPHGQGGGGGISEIQALPSYQKGLAASGSHVSSIMRNVPDVSLYGDYDTGAYAVYMTDPANPGAGGQWGAYNGTSAASPLWAGFMALVNQGRAAAGRGPIGFLNPAIYALGKNATIHTRDFHDVSDGTTNLYYPAASGYDLATGWGSFQGANLIADLVSSGTVPSVTGFSPGTGSVGQTVTVFGSGFAGATSVAFDGASAAFSIGSDGRVTATVPAGAKTGLISIANAFGTGNSVTIFVIASSGSPVITTISPSNAPTGSAVSILGNGFTGATLITVGGVSVAFTIINDGKITFTIPAGLRGGSVQVTTARGTAVSAGRVTVPLWASLGVAAVPDGTARMLWVRSDGAAGIWMMDTHNHVASFGPTYGPYATGSSAWNAFAIAAAPDGTSRLLWTRGDGAAGVWTLNAQGQMPHVGPTYGPYADSTGTWQAYGIAVAPDGTARLLWNRSDHAMGIWTLNQSDVMTKIGPTYGPYADSQGNAWNALSIAAVSDGTTRVLWSRMDGAMGVWSFDASNRQSVVGPVYGPYTDAGGDWYAISLGVATDGTSHVLWGRSDGAAGVWSLNGFGTETSIGSIEGPYAQFSPYGLATGGEQSRLLWVRNDRAAGLWTLNSGNQETTIGPTYGPY